MAFYDIVEFDTSSCGLMDHGVKCRGTLSDVPHPAPSMIIAALFSYSKCAPTGQRNNVIASHQ